LLTSKLNGKKYRSKAEVWFDWAGVDLVGFKIEVGVAAVLRFCRTVGVRKSEASIPDSAGRPGEKNL